MNNKYKRYPEIESEFIYDVDINGEDLISFATYRTWIRKMHESIYYLIRVVRNFEYRDPVPLAIHIKDKKLFYYDVYKTLQFYIIDPESLEALQRFNEDSILIDPDQRPEHERLGLLNPDITKHGT